MGNKPGDKQEGGTEGYRKFDKDIVIAALIKAGTQSGAAVIVGCNRQTIINYCDEDPEIEKAVHEAKEILVDMAETALMSNVKKGHQSAVNFVLSTLGKDRGYVKRVENTGKGGGPIEGELVVKTNNKKLHSIIDNLTGQASEEEKKPPKKAKKK